MAEDDVDNEVENEAEAPVEGGEESFDQAAEKKGGSKKLLLILVPLLLLIGGGAGAYFMGLLDPLLGKEEVVCEPAVDDHGEPVLDDHGEPVMNCPEAHAEEEGGHGDEGGHGEEEAEEDHGGGGHGGGHGKDGEKATKFVEIPTMIVNLNTEDGTPRFLRLTVQIELERMSDRSAIEGVMPRVVDQFQTYLRELRVKDLRGSSGIYRLQMELLWRVNQAAAPVKVKDVLFQEILIQ